MGPENRLGSLYFLLHSAPPRALACGGFLLSIVYNLCNLFKKTGLTRFENRTELHITGYVQFQSGFWHFMNICGPVAVLVHAQ